MHIEVVGPGCPFCRKLYQRTREVVEEKGMDAEVRHVTDLKTAMKYFPMTPVLIVDGRVVVKDRVCLTVDEEEARRAGCDAVLKKPFEASVVLETIRPLIDRARFARGLFAESVPAPPPPEPPRPGAAAPQKPEIDPEAVRAAVTLALDRSLPTLVEEISEKILIALGH